MKFLLAVLLVFSVCVLPAAASGPKQLDLQNPILWDSYRGWWIEQQDDWPMPENPMYNPTGCMWSVNDHRRWGTAQVPLNAGATTSRSDCQIEDFNPVYSTQYGITTWWSIASYGYAGLLVTAPSSALVVSVCYQPQNRCFTLPAVANGTGWTYRFCGRVSYLPDDPALQDIEGSNGGRGVISSVTYTVRNPTNRAIRNVQAGGGISSDVNFPYGCEDRSGMQSDYPFVYRNG